jgi:hypothetical protein
MVENAREQLRDIDKDAKSDGNGLHQTILQIMAALDRNDVAALHSIAERLFREAGPRGPAD